MRSGPEAHVYLLNVVDLVKSFQIQTSIYYLLAKFGFDTAEKGILASPRRKRASQSLPKNTQTLENKLEKNTGPRGPR